MIFSKLLIKVVWFFCYSEEKLREEKVERGKQLLGKTTLNWGNIFLAFFCFKKLFFKT
ncbi:hypothetical protein PA0057 [Candidatus Phytoplasma australiense]|uniref:Uncharacterized protein n=2 Tax=Phytoplasma australiense TaxID=59748 RepID=B1V8R4_PHYAS|nr:Hypothetical Protein SLY_0075 [Strawberry lethal yellows phytoplasma (CPA) str. NZSb11]CAM11392.1 hypothetical protein PA0057 [Candidatus Phytoplasma australiense]